MKLKIINESSNIRNIVKEEVNLALKEISLNPLKWFSKTPSTYRQPRHPSRIPLLDQAMFDFENRENLEHMQAVAKSMDGMYKGRDYKAAVKAHKSGDTGEVWSMVLGYKYHGLEPWALANDDVRVEDVSDMLASLAYDIEKITQIVKEFKKGASRWERAIDGAQSDDSERIMRKKYAWYEEKAAAAAHRVKWWEKVLASPKLMSSFKHLSIDNMKKLSDMGDWISEYISEEGFESFKWFQKAGAYHAAEKERWRKDAYNDRENARQDAAAERYRNMSNDEKRHYDDRQKPSRHQAAYWTTNRPRSY